MFTRLIRFLILVFGFWNKPPKHNSKRTLRCVCFLWCFDSNLECHLNIEVWNSFLILSCLSVLLTSVHAHDTQNLIELKSLLETMKSKFNACTQRFMHCYLLELEVFLEEEGIHDEDDPKHKIFSLEQMYFSSSSNCPACQQCEEHPTRNTTVFSETMKDFISMLLAKGTPETNDC
ncbi:interleukin-15 isoform X2 [Brachyhypopomus gauderio]|uniref:interleukin-15 isoform X2 n=1 Tax=Brachyhypopomus gauderio TaxID=698409 RepID=UPI0040434FD3